MHIAIFTDYYLPTLGGIQTSIKAQKEALEGLGHKVTLFCPGHVPSSDATIITLPTLKYFRPDGYPVAGTTKKVIKAAIKEVKNLKDIDIIHVHSDMAVGVAGLIVAKECGIPSVQSMHGREDVYATKVLPLPNIYSLIITRLHSKYISHKNVTVDASGKQAQSSTARRMWRLMVSHANFADHVIVPSNHFAKKLISYGLNKPLTVVSNGVEDTVISQLKHAKQRHYDAKSPLKIMWCGRMSPEKRPMEFLEAIKKIDTYTQVNMYGGGISLKKVQKLIKSNKFSGDVQAHGSVSQETVLKQMTKHHLLAYTSFDFDNQPMVLIEAIVSGLPVVYCDPDLGEVIPAKGSLLASDPSPDAIYNCIKSIIKKPQQIGAMSQEMLNSRVGVSQSSHIQALMSVYKNTINNY